jgi:hypothetical protein
MHQRLAAIGEHRRICGRYRVTTHKCTPGGELHATATERRLRGATMWEFSAGSRFRSGRPLFGAHFALNSYQLL